MAPRKGKQPIKETTVEDTPVVFFLKINLDDELQAIAPAGDVTTYSEILHAVESSKISERFNTELLKSILDKSNVNRYNEHTSCFWCCHSFGWTPSILPVSYDAYKDLFTCEGNFCSPECSLAYLYREVKTSDGNRWNRHTLLRHLYGKMYQNRELSPAPPRTLLRMFGGPLDIEQYRDFMTGSNDIVLSDLPPIRVQFPSMNVTVPLRDIKKYVSLSTDTIEKASQELRLKRSKPVHVNIPTLDMCLNQKQPVQQLHL